MPLRLIILAVMLFVSSASPQLTVSSGVPQEVPGVFVDRKRLSLLVPDKGQGGLGFQTVGHGERHEG